MTSIPTTPPLVLGPELSIPLAAATQTTLLAALQDAPGDLTVDLSGVTDFDSSAVQLLLATQRSLRERGHALVVTGTSVTVRDALKVFGLGDLSTPTAAT